MWEALEQMGWVKTFGSTGWMYASVSVIHYLTMFWFIGSMAVVDLRVMGIAARKRNLSELAGQLFPRLTTVRVPRYQMGRKSIEVLARRIAGEAGLPKQVAMPFVIVERETT